MELISGPSKARKMRHKRMLELMGKIVTVKKIYRRLYSHGSRSWEAVPIPPRAGWIIGFRTIQNGEYRGSFSNDEQACLKVTETVPCMLVVFWPTMKPVRVPIRYAVGLGGEPISPAYKWTDKDKELMREVVQTMSRDKDGRWNRTMADKNVSSAEPEPEPSGISPQN